MKHYYKRAPRRYDVQSIHPLLVDSSSNSCYDERGILYEGQVCSLLEKSRKLCHRYLVLNSHAIFIFKDDLAF